MKKVIWVTWEKQRRNKEIANSIDALYNEIIINGNRIKRYILSLYKTANLYIKEKPDVVICQNPSVVLALFTVIFKKVFGYCAGVDTHNGGLALDSSSELLKKVAKFIQRNADFIIITNEPLKEIVENNGGTAIVLPDKIPDIKKAKIKKLQHKTNLLFICTYAGDEPFEEVFKSAGILKNVDDVGIYVTGNYTNKVEPSMYSDNLHFMGRIPWDDFDSMLQSADAVIDLTTRENCLICGAYESVSVKTPMILSNTEALKTYFNKGAVYAENTKEGIVNAVIEFISKKNILKDEVSKLKHELQTGWDDSKENLLNHIRS